MSETVVWREKSVRSVAVVDPALGDDNRRWGFKSRGERLRPSAASSEESRVNSAKLHRGRETNSPSKLDHNVVRPLRPPLLVVFDEHSAQVLDATRHLSLSPPLPAPHHEAFPAERFGVCG